MFKSLISRTQRHIHLPHKTPTTYISARMSSNSENPSLIGGHAQYVKGAAENLVGSVTGSKEWQDSGSHDTEAGVNAMKAASANRDANSGYGKIEEVAGKVTGCEGMGKEGARGQSKKE
ncbi:hypothetical protein BDV97DRAFT_341207 [Delphinella strobiligena]|nr:hypothetical protein BDV97DRAFT_341207 [Delphinella strobiligena]